MSNVAALCLEPLCACECQEYLLEGSVADEVVFQVELGLHLGHEFEEAAQCHRWVDDMILKHTLQ